MATTIIEGHWHKQGSAARSAATLRVESDRYDLQAQTDVAQFGSLDEILVSDRLGNVERKLTLPDGSVFTTRDNDQVDTLFKEHTKANGVLHAIESNLSFAIVALVFTIVIGFSFFKWGIPAVSHSVAQALPQKIGNVIGANSLAFLDDYLFEPSQLETKQQQQISDQFNNSLLALATSDDKVPYKLHFRAWGEGDTAIPNAFALPSGDIILTDKFVELSENQNEIDSVLLHEIGHVEHRHTLEMVVQTTLFAAVIALFTGDASGAGDMGIGLGSLLVSTNYSRNHESEADQYAFEKMLLAGVDPSAFASIMTKISEIDFTAQGKSNEQDGNDTESDKNTDNYSNNNDKFLDYFSTHPATEDRIKQAQHYSQCYKKGLKVCDAL